MSESFRNTVFAAMFLIALPCFLCEARTITFAGHEWQVRTGQGGPGPNRWSDSETSVWVDDDGLHLRIRRIDGAWHCAEVTAKAPARYGVYRFYVSSRVDQLDRNVVAAPFLYADDTKEIDIEFSAWGKTGTGVEYGQYVVQPYHRKGNMHRFGIDLAEPVSTHTIDWSAETIRFCSVHGHDAHPADRDRLIQEWCYRGADNPKEEDGLKLHINLWLVGGRAPSDGQEAEFVIKKVEMPMGPGERTE